MRIEQSSINVLQQLEEHIGNCARGRSDQSADRGRLQYWRRSLRCARYGGFGQAPKFPRPVTLNFLLRYYA